MRSRYLVCLMLLACCAATKSSKASKPKTVIKPAPVIVHGRIFKETQDPDTSKVHKDTSSPPATSPQGN